MLNNTWWSGNLKTKRKRSVIVQKVYRSTKPDPCHIKSRFKKLTNRVGMMLRKFLVFVPKLFLTCHSCNGLFYSQSLNQKVENFKGFKEAFDIIKCDIQKSWAKLWLPVSKRRLQFCCTHILLILWRNLIIEIVLETKESLTFY